MEQEREFNLKTYFYIISIYLPTYLIICQRRGKEGKADSCFVYNPITLHFLIKNWVVANRPVSRYCILFKAMAFSQKPGDGVVRSVLEKKYY